MVDRGEAIARLALEKGMLGGEALDAARSELDARRRAGEATSLEQVLVDRRSLTPDQVRELVAGLPARILVCTGEGCGRRFRITAFEPRRIYRCKECGDLLGVGEAERSVAPATAGQSTAVEPAEIESDDDPDHLEVLDVLGEAGQGIVYRAIDRGLRRRVAVKCLRGPFPAQSPPARRFLREARVNGQLEHPNIVPIYRLGRWPDGRSFLAMKLVRGRTLEQMLGELKKRGGPATAVDPRVEERGRLLRDFLKVCEAVAYAHDRGVIHRDLKPANIMVGQFGEVQVMDWGIARIVSTDLSSELGIEDEPPGGAPERVDIGDVAENEASLAHGTPAYMPPEQFDGDLERIGPRSDVYSLGVVLYEILTLSRPYSGPSAIAYGMQHLAGRLEPPSERAPGAGIARELDAVVGRAMRPAPEERYATVLDLAADVEAFLTGHALRAADYTLPQLLAKWARRNRGKLIGAAATMLALLGGVVGVTLAVRRGEARAERLADQARAEETTRREGEAEALFAEGEAGWREAAARFPEFHPGNAQSYFQVHLAALLAMARGLQTHPVRPESWRQAIAARSKELQARAQESGNWALARVLAESVEVWGAAPSDERRARLALVESVEQRALAEDIELLDEALARIEAAERAGSRQREQGRLVPGELEERARRVASGAEPGLADEVLARIDGRPSPPASPVARRFLIEMLGRTGEPWTRSGDVRAVDRIEDVLSRAAAGRDGLPAAEVVAWIRAAVRFAARHREALVWIDPLLARLREEAEDRRETIVVQAVDRARDRIDVACAGASLASADRERERFRGQVEFLADTVVGRVRSGSALTASLLDRCLPLAGRSSGSLGFLFDVLGLRGDCQPPDPERPGRHAPALLAAAERELPDEWLPDEPPAGVAREAWERRRAVAFSAIGNLSRLGDAALAERLRVRRRGSGIGSRFEHETELAYALLPLGAWGEPRSADEFEARGRARLTARDFAGALEDFTSAIAIEPRRGLYRNQRGLARLSMGDLEAAIEDFSRAFELDGRLSSALVNRGHVRYLLRDLAGAVADFDRALSIDPTARDAHLDRGLVRHAQGRYAEAIEDYDRAIDLAPERAATAHNNRAMALASLGRHQEARADLDRAIEIDPRYADAFANRGNVRIELGDPEGALADLGRAIDLDPSLVHGWVNRAVARSRSGDHAGAIRDYDRALDLDPGDATIWFNRGKARQAIGDPDGAIADLGEAIARRPDYAAAHHRRGLARRDQGDLAAALGDIDRAIELEPRAVFHNDRGLVRRAVGDVNGAVEDYNRAIELEPDHVVARLNLANARLVAGRPEEALAGYTEVLALDPGLWQAWLNRAVALAVLGRPEEAGRSFDEALERCPASRRSYVIEQRAKRLGR